MRSSDTPTSRNTRTHADAERFSRALHDDIAQRLRTEPDLIDRARANIAHWEAMMGHAAPRDLEVWRDILNQGIEAIIRVLTARDATSDRLRQSSPFAGVVPHHRRWELLRESRRRETPRA